MDRQAEEWSDGWTDIGIDGQMEDEEEEESVGGLMNL